MNYEVKVFRHLSVVDTYHVDVPDSILADIMMNNEGLVSEVELVSYILGEYEPTDSYVADEDVVDVAIFSADEGVAA